LSINAVVALSRPANGYALVIALPSRSLVLKNCLLAVAELCLGKGLTFRALGEVNLKGFDRPVQVYAVEWPGATAAH
jgi:class 3 adenylate cyclase